jgi:hypothetical protein
MESLELKKYYNNTITLWRKSTAGDDFGGVSTTWDKLYWKIPCRIYGKQGAPYTLSLEGKQYLVEMKMMCSKNTDIKLGDKIKEDNANETYMVVFIKAARRYKDIHHLECSLSRMDVADEA